jgi:hypothetical protein
VTTRRRLAVSLLVCGLVAHAGADTGLGAAKPSPKELWQLYPLDPTGRGERERPVTTTEAGRPSQPPRGGVAGTGRTVTVGTQQGSGDDGGGGTSVSFALLLGGLVGAILLLSLAALPPPAFPRLARLRVDRRLDIGLAGALALLVVTLVYLASAL